MLLGHGTIFTAYKVISGNLNLSVVASLLLQIDSVKCSIFTERLSYAKGCAKHCHIHYLI